MGMFTAERRSGDSEHNLFLKSLNVLGISRSEKFQVSEKVPFGFKEEKLATKADLKLLSNGLAMYEASILDQLRNRTLQMFWSLLDERVVG